MNYSALQNQAIALAGMLQALSLVKEIARTGYLNSQDFETCIKSLFEDSPESTLSVYGSLGLLERGFGTTESLLNERIGSHQKDLINYAVGINNLAGKLLRNKNMLATVGQRLHDAKHQSTHFGVSHDNVISNIADIYSKTISTFSYRIQVKGEYTYLQQQRVADQIRALLLAAIRASILWRQNGGSVWRLLLGRNKLHKEVQALLETSKYENQA
ncbi:high frequency lysogenization protein HflD [Marinagarivorans cellulosilyticus]|uniref:High frequency lysogenization protein HflD homolog n=1 Tax=Marinagarivorans cellulosilyticus TaxID=2721545 RepID=A0AAN2BLE5_9GAMM|nr:high frequency lysogenization protein HflD [Marinagarivorans cellulosilyticus]BCD98940.1 high frequency lysogenization protein [Marinagarivorans cellulosilyticus]